MMPKKTTVSIEFVEIRDGQVYPAKKITKKTIRRLVVRNTVFGVIVSHELKKEDCIKLANELLETALGM
jgi:hypothetical protein